MTQQELKLQRIPNVLAASIGASTKRERRLGRYHVSDLTGLGVEACARLYAGLDPEEDFPAYLAKRGLILEEMALAALPENQKQPEILYKRRGMRIVGHPDGITLDEDGNPVPVEVASQLSAEDDSKEEIKLDQNLIYGGLKNMGATLTLRDGTMVPGPVNEVRIVLCGLWEGAEIPYTEIQEQARERAEWVVAKAHRVDNLAHALLHASGVGETAEDHAQIQAMVDEPLAVARKWDERYPSRGRFEREVAPILEGERGEEADAAVQAYAAWKDFEKSWKELYKPRWEATLDLDTLKKVKAPCGGTITLRARNVKEMDQEVYAKMDGPELEEKVAGLIAQVEADTRALLEQYEAARREHPHAKQIPELQAEIERAREAATVTRQVPNGVLVTRPKGKKEAGS